MQHFHRTHLTSRRRARARRRLFPDARTLGRNENAAHAHLQRRSGHGDAQREAGGRALHVRRGDHRSDGRESSRPEREEVLRARCTARRIRRTRWRRRTSHGHSPRFPRGVAPSDALSLEQKLELYYWMRLTRIARGAARESLPADEGRRWTLPLARAGGRRRGQRLRARPERRRHFEPAHSQPGLDAREGRAAAGDHPPVHGQGRFADARTRAEHPLRRARSRLHRPDLASGRHGPGDGRGHALVQDARREARGTRLRGRRRDVDGRLSRRDQLRGGAALPARRDRGEQRLRVLDAEHEAERREGVRGQGDRRTAFRAIARTATTCSRRTT